MKFAETYSQTMREKGLKMFIKKLISMASIGTLLFLFTVGPVSASPISIAGNDASFRSITDTYQNFTIIDTNHPVLYTGTITDFGYYAANTNPFSFVVVNSVNVVTYVSPLIYPSVIGAQTYTPGAPITVAAGDNIGMYFNSTGTIPFEYVGTPTKYTPNNVGPPVVGTTLSFEGTSGRTYSLFATVARLPWMGSNRSMGYYKKNGLPTLLPSFCLTQDVSAITSMSTPVLFAVAPNTAYTLTSAGTYFANDGIYADAKYSERNNSGFWTDLVQNYESYGPELLDLQTSIDLTSFVSPNWGAFNSSHDYSVNYITGAAQTQLLFRINDIAPANNTGVLTVEVCSIGTRFTTAQVQTAMDNYSAAPWNKFLTQYGVTLFNFQRNPNLGNAIYDTGTSPDFDGLTVFQLMAIAETYSASTSKGDLLALKDVFDNINNNRYIWMP